MPNINELSYFDIFLVNSCINTFILLYWFISTFFKKQ